jgi:hypothetical protein
MDRSTIRTLIDYMQSRVYEASRFQVTNIKPLALARSRLSSADRQSQRVQDARRCRLGAGAMSQCCRTDARLALPKHRSVHEPQHWQRLVTEAATRSDPRIGRLLRVGRRRPRQGTAVLPTTTVERLSRRREGGTRRDARGERNSSAGTIRNSRPSASRILTGETGSS